MILYCSTGKGQVAAFTKASLLASHFAQREAVVELNTQCLPQVGGLRLVSEEQDFVQVGLLLEESWGES